MFDVMGGMRRLQRQAARRLPAMRRRRGPNPAVVTAPIVAVAGMAVAGLLLWDERRRAAMRKRMENVASTVGASVSSSLNRVAPAVPTGAAKD